MGFTILELSSILTLKLTISLVFIGKINRLVLFFYFFKMKLEVGPKATNVCLEGLPFILKAIFRLWKNFLSLNLYLFLFGSDKSVY